MSYENITQHTSPFQAPRTQDIESITIHWWDKPERNPSFDGTVSWLCRQGTTASAHYVVEDGRVACIVDPDAVAWHAGDGGSGKGNMTSIGIECNPRQSEGDYATAAELISELRAVYGDLPLYPHRHWTNTECPGSYDLARLDAQARGKQWATAPAPAPETKRRTIHLPGNVNHWNIYPLGVAPVRGNQHAALNPQQFGGLTYSVAAWVSPNVALIDTAYFGRVQIYVGPDTPAVIS